MGELPISKPTPFLVHCVLLLNPCITFHGFVCFWPETQEFLHYTVAESCRHRTVTDV